MNKLAIKIPLSVLAIVAVLFSLPSYAGDVTVKWQEPAKFTDIDAAEQPKDGFQAALFKNFDNVFTELARKLPDAVRWEVTVTDLDLAGEVLPDRTGRNRRIVKPLFRPAISFSYRLVDSQDKIIKEATVDLKDPLFMSRSPTQIGLNTKPFPYEEFMINQWFEQQQNQHILPSK